MKKTTTLLLVAFVATLFAFQWGIKINQETFRPMNSGGAGPGKTGAPGESNCTACHAGSVMDGANVNVLTLSDASGPVTSYVPGNTYAVTLAMSTNPQKKGFQATALNTSDEMAGSFSASMSTAISSLGGRSYANHISASNTSAVSQWLWDWTAPSSSTGNVTFYVSSNHANGNGATSGDEIFLSQHTFTEDDGASLDKHSFFSETASFIPETNELYIALNRTEMGILDVALFDLNGKQVFNKKKLLLSSGDNSIRLKVNSTVGNGTYIVTLKLGLDEISKTVKILR